MEFIDVKGFEDILGISRCGKVLGKRSGKVLKTFITKEGYEIFSTKIGGRHGKSYAFKVHRLVAQTFLENEFNKDQVNHIDGVKSNNKVENLEWCTNQENSIHAHELGLVDVSKVSGCRNIFSKIDEKSLKELRDLKGKMTTREAGRLFGIHHTNVSRIWREVSYKNAGKVFTDTCVPSKHE